MRRSAIMCSGWAGSRQVRQRSGENYTEVPQLELPDDEALWPQPTDRGPRFWWPANAHHVGFRPRADTSCPRATGHSRPPRHSRPCLFVPNITARVSRRGVTPPEGLVYLGPTTSRCRPRRRSRCTVSRPVSLAAPLAIRPRRTIITDGAERPGTRAVTAPTAITAAAGATNHIRYQRRPAPTTSPGQDPQSRTRTCRRSTPIPSRHADVISETSSNTAASWWSARPPGVDAPSVELRMTRVPTIGGVLLGSPRWSGLSLGRSLPRRSPLSSTVARGVDCPGWSSSSPSREP